MYENKFVSLLEVITIMVLVVVAVAGKRYFFKKFLYNSLFDSYSYNYSYYFIVNTILQLRNLG